MTLPALAGPYTARLALRPLATKDARELLSIVAISRAELGRFMTWPREMTDLEHARRFIALGREGWLTERTARFGMIDRATGELLGTVELDAVDFRRSQAELGYWIRTDRAGRGFTTEAARAALFYAFGTLSLHKVRADVAVGNTPSARVLEKLGFSLEGTLREDRPIGGVFTDHWRYGLLARDFTASIAPTRGPVVR
jgi:ribosomal-protein-alanine N-acetyltransferase